MNKFFENKQNDVRALILRGKIYSKQQHWQDALNDLEVAEKQDSENPEVQILLDNVHTAMGNTKTAKQHLKNYQRISRKQIKQNQKH